MMIMSLLSMNIEAEFLTSFEFITLFFIYSIWAYYILDLYAFLLISTPHLFLYAWQHWADAQSSNNVNAPTPEVLSLLPTTPKPSQDEEDALHVVDNDQKLSLFEGEVKMVMERLGVSCHEDGGKIQEQVGSNEIATLFDENEPSLEEVKEAFDVFDANNDGYIDAMELRKVLCSLGFVQVPEQVCQSMISSYDADGDGRVNFSEFVKLFEKSFY